MLARSQYMFTLLQSAAILSDGSLLIPSLSTSDSAHYQCQAWFGLDTVNSTVRVVSVDNSKWSIIILLSCMHVCINILK